MADKHGYTISIGTKGKMITIAKPKEDK
jgi:hypothetical protein